MSLISVNSTEYDSGLLVWSRFSEVVFFSLVLLQWDLDFVQPYSCQVLSTYGSLFSILFILDLKTQSAPTSYGPLMATMISS